MVFTSLHHEGSAGQTTNGRKNEQHYGIARYRLGSEDHERWRLSGYTDGEFFRQRENPDEITTSRLP